jgi:hypothetical protein
MTGLPETLTRIALFQHEVLTAQQLLAAGVSSAYLKSQVRQGNWQRLYRGVYATYSGEPPRLGRLWAAVLWAGDGAMLSHESAAELAGLAAKPARVIHVTVPIRRTVTKVRGVEIHRSSRCADARHPARLPPRTTTEETVLDLAAAAAQLDDAVGWVTRAPSAAG